MKRRTFLKNVPATAAIGAAGGCIFSSKSNSPGTNGSMPARKLGKTDIVVSRLGYGSHIDDRDLRRNQNLRNSHIRMAYEAGINCFDVYEHSYAQFEPMGQTVKDFRKDIILSVTTAIRNLPILEDEIIAALRKLQTDYIDLYRLNGNGGVGEVVDDDLMNIMEKYKKEGKIRAIGIVAHDANVIMSYLDDYQDVLDYVMLVYNFHHNDGAYTNESYPRNDYSALIPRCKQLGLGILSIKPMGSRNMIAYAKLHGYFDDPKAHICQAMLRHVFQNDEIDCTFTGMNSVDELNINLEAARNPELSAYEQEMLDKLSAEVSALNGAYLSPQYRWLEKWAKRIA